MYNVYIFRPACKIMLHYLQWFCMLIRQSITMIVTIRQSLTMIEIVIWLYLKSVVVQIHRIGISAATQIKKIIATQIQFVLSTNSLYYQNHFFFSLYYLLINVFHFLIRGYIIKRAGGKDMIMKDIPKNLANFESIYY